jgi:hypothetical protein
VCLIATLVFLGWVLTSDGRTGRLERLLAALTRRKADALRQSPHDEGPDGEGLGRQGEQRPPSGPPAARWQRPSRRRHG